MTGIQKPSLIDLVIAAAGAALVIWLYLNGEVIEAAISGQMGREAIIAAIWNHVGWGVVSTPLVLAYAFLRLHAERTPYFQRDTLGRIGKIILWALVALLIFLVVTGPIVVWTYGSDLKVFDLFVIPTPTGKLPVVHDPLEVGHIWAAKASPWVAGLDLAAAIMARLRR
ncbi:hypothetical protein PUV54_03210 [Hyphococcus flavus]|uniref:Uncharacterized protein n=1 Tax=Hyphococcus flavus TaxID=1866326 RepID=A0AAF0CBZ4_9PROT|nr:hypothetical protein [Hyphococcus flavus]WDI32200.1 hypothetical protein PUV54_03210 [Hyphococcus flavus]